MKQERLTKEVELPFGSTYAPKCKCIETGSTVTFGQMLAYDGVCAKLGKHENIEERYGIEILTIFKVLVDGCYYLYRGEVKHFVPSGSDFACPNLDNESMDLMYASTYEDLCHITVTLPFSEFGKTWALTKEELL